MGRPTAGRRRPFVAARARRETCQSSSRHGFIVSGLFRAIPRVDVPLRAKRRARTERLAREGRQIAARTTAGDLSVATSPPERKNTARARPRRSRAPARGEDTRPAAVARGTRGEREASGRWREAPHDARMPDPRAVAPRSQNEAAPTRESTRPVHGPSLITACNYVYAIGTRGCGTWGGRESYAKSTRTNDTLKGRRSTRTQ